MKRLIIFLLLFAAIKVAGQTTGYLRFDTVLIYKQGGTAELILMNKTKDSLGILTNYSGGRTRFIKSRAINDSTIVVGLDTLVIRGANSSGSNTNLGSGFRWLVPASQGIKTATAGYGFLIDSTSTANSLRFRVDTTGPNGLVTRPEFLDSLNRTTIVRKPILALEGSDDSVPDTLDFRIGYGLMRNASDSALRVDTFNIMTRGLGQKKIDSVAAFLSSATITDTAIIKALGYRPGTQALVSTNKFVRLTACVFRPDITAGVGNPITWEIITSGGHDYIYVDSVVSDAVSSGFRVYYPRVREVIMAGIIPDETLAAFALKPGASINTQYALFNVYKQVTYSGTLTGNGSTWSADGNLSGISLDYNTSTGLTRFNLPGTGLIPAGTDYTRVIISYNGDSAGRFIRRVTSGLVSYNFGFTIRDLFGSTYTGNLSAADRVVINTAIPFSTAFQSATVSTENSSVYTTLSNWWYWGIMEVWMNATNVNSTSNYIEWQADAAASSYKIYRATSGTFSGETLVYSGTGTSFQDFGLSANTLYYYRMVSVVSGVDTERTRGEKCRTAN